MSLRFAQLPIGARFRWQQRCYRKVSPLEASDLETDGRRLVPRSTKVEPLDEAAATGRDPAELRLDREAVESAVDACLGRLRQRLVGLLPGDDAIRRSSLDTVLQGARTDLLGELRLAALARPTTDDSPGTHRA